MDTDKKNFRPDRSCEACHAVGAALVSEDPEDAPHYLCETCMKLGLNRKMSVEEVVTLLEKHWGIEANSQVDKCPKCGSERIFVQSIDNKRYFIKCSCTTQEGYQDTHYFRMG